MKTFRLPATAIALGIAVLASASIASAETAGASSNTNTAQAPAQTYSVVALTSQNPTPRTVGSVSTVSQGPMLSDFTTKALTPQQMNSAYDRYVLATLRIDPAIAHTP